MASIRTLLLSLLFAGCTVAPGLVRQAPAPADTAQESVAVPGGRLITASQYARYNALIASYGKARYPDKAPIFIPALEKDYGITKRPDGSIFMTDEAAEDFRVMSRLAKSGFTP